MESRLFIKEAAAMIERIEENRNVVATAVQLSELRDGTQKDLTQLFQGLQNPTLPSAFRLRDAALRNGYQLPALVLNNLSRFE